MLANLRTKRKLGRLIKMWLHYRDAVHEALAVEEPTPAQEARFLRLKANIASQLHFLAESIPPSLDNNAHKSVVGIQAMLQSHRELLLKDPEGTLGADAFQREWHEHYIVLNRLRGMPLGKARRKTRKVGGVPTGMPRFGFVFFPVRRVLGTLGRSVTLALLIYVVAMAIGVRRLDGRFTVDFPASATIALENVLNGFSTLVAAAKPMVIAYGPLAAVVVGVLILGTYGYRTLFRSSYGH